MGCRPAQVPGAISNMAVTVVKPGGNSAVWTGVRLTCANADAQIIITIAPIPSDFLSILILHLLNAALGSLPYFSPDRKVVSSVAAQLTPQPHPSRTNTRDTCMCN
jgi:hypothetical protein